MHPDTDICPCLTEHDLIHPSPPSVCDSQQILRKVPHKEPRNRFLRTVHQNPDATKCERYTVLGSEFGEFAAGLDEQGGIEVREGPGGRFCADSQH